MTNKHIGTNFDDFLKEEGLIMTTDIERQFFETFGIEPIGCNDNKNCTGVLDCRTQCPNAKYPEITDRILLELICIVLNAFDQLEVYTEYTVEKVKEKTLKQLILAQDDVYSQVQALFKEG